MVLSLRGGIDEEPAPAAAATTDPDSDSDDAHRSQSAGLPWPIRRRVAAAIQASMTGRDEGTKTPRSLSPCVSWLHKGPNVVDKRR